MVECFSFQLPRPFVDGVIILCHNIVEFWIEIAYIEIAFLFEMILDFIFYLLLIYRPLNCFIFTGCYTEYQNGCQKENKTGMFEFHS